MALSIIQRLTFTSALLTAAVLGPAGIVLYLIADSSIQGDGARTVFSQAHYVVETILYHWDEEFLVEFKGKRAGFEDLKLDFRDWAVTYGNGRVVHASGVFKSDIAPVVVRSSKLLKTKNDKSFRIAAVHLIEARALRFEELPEPVRSVTSRLLPKCTFLRAKREVSKDQNIFEVKMLEGDHLQEIKITDDGSLLSREMEKLPKSIPEDLVSEITQDKQGAAFEALSWSAYDGQLLALLKGRTPDGHDFQVAVNRLGERFALDSEGEVIGQLEEWRLWLVAALNARSEVAAIRSLRLALWIGGPLTWVAMILGGWYVARKAMSPVRDIVDAAKRIELTHLNERLPVKGASDELSRIVLTINKMLDRLEAGYLRERQFTGDASHELRSPIAKVIAEIDLALSRERANEDYRSTLERCRAYAEAMQRIVESLLVLSRLDAKAMSLNIQPFDIVDLAVETIHAFASEDTGRIKVKLQESEGPLVVLGERSLIGIMLHNLIENALRYSLPDSLVTVEITTVKKEIVVSVEDEGPGIADDQIELVFQRFHRIEKSRSRQTGGVGLGLPIVRAIAQAHKIPVELLRRPVGRGTLATFSLPPAAYSQAAAAASPRGRELPG